MVRENGYRKDLMDDTGMGFVRTFVQVSNRRAWALLNFVSHIVWMGRVWFGHIEICRMFRFGFDHFSFPSARVRFFFSSVSFFTFRRSLVIRYTSSHSHWMLWLFDGRRLCLNYALEAARWNNMWMNLPYECGNGRPTYFVRNKMLVFLSDGAFFGRALVRTGTKK